MAKISLIFGSSRSNGNTSKLVDELLYKTGAECYDLNDYAIGYYDYEYHNADDDFIPLMQNMVPQTEVYVLVTPVYWYSMAAVMKTWLDRWSDLIRVHKELGYQMRGKKMCAISSSQGEPYPSVGIPFELSAQYMKMEWLGHTHVRIDGDAVVPTFPDEYDDLLKKITV